jgi:HK97 family phage portal protein
MDSVYEQRGITLQDGIESGLVQTIEGLKAGKGLGEQAALGISAIWCAVKVISEAVGSLPIVVKNKDGSVAENHPLNVMFDEPNGEQTRPVFFETEQSHALLFGNAYAEIEREDGTGRPKHLHVIHPRNMRVTRDDAGLVYSVNAGAVKADFRQENVVHVPGLSPDGSVGYRILSLARDTIGFALSAQKYGNALFRNMVRPGGALEYPGVLSDIARENVRRSWQQLHGGDQVGTMAILEEGMQFKPFTMTTNEQSQYKELLQWFVYEAARLFNCPPSKIHSLEKATWGNLETLNQDFLTTTLRPWLDKWEAELTKKLIMPSEKGRYSVEFVTDELLRTDKQARYTAYGVALTHGFLSVNEVRAQEGYPPVDGGDVHRFPLNLGQATPQPRPDEDTTNG